MLGLLVAPEIWAQTETSLVSELSSSSSSVSLPLQASSRTVSSVLTVVVVCVTGLVRGCSVGVDSEECAAGDAAAVAASVVVASESRDTLVFG